MPLGEVCSAACPTVKPLSPGHRQGEKIMPRSVGKTLSTQSPSPAPERPNFRWSHRLYVVFILSQGQGTLALSLIILPKEEIIWTPTLPLPLNCIKMLLEVITTFVPIKLTIIIPVLQLRTGWHYSIIDTSF